MSPQRPPSRIAWLIAFVSSVIPSPICQSKFRQYHAFQFKRKLYTTFGTVLLNISSDHIAGWIGIVGSYSPLGHIGKPKSGGTRRLADFNTSFNSNVCISSIVDVPMETFMAMIRCRQDKWNSTQKDKKSCSLKRKSILFSSPESNVNRYICVIHTSDPKEFCRRLTAELVVYRAISSVTYNLSLDIEREEKKSKGERKEGVSGQLFRP